MIATRLPDGRGLSIEGAAVGRLSCGVLVLAGVAPPGSDGLAAEIAGLEALLRERHAGCAPSEVPGLAEARALYKSFGMDPSRHRPSSEALLRRVLQGKGLYRLGAVVDACNLASLGFLLPIGLYDLSRVRGDICLRVGEPGDAYAGIRKDEVHVGGRLALYDAVGPFGSPTSDSLRTSTDASTRDLLAVVMATAGYPTGQMSANLDHMAGLYERHAGARAIWRTLLGGGKDE